MKKQAVFVSAMVVLLAVSPWALEPAFCGTFEPNQCYTWGISNENLPIREGSIITEAVLTIHNITNWDNDTNDALYVYLLDNPPLDYVVNEDDGSGDCFKNEGILLTLDYDDPNLTCTFSNSNDPCSWVWERFVYPLVFGPNDSLVIDSSLILELIDYAGNSTPFGFGFDPNGIDTYDFDKITLELTLESFKGEVEEYSVTFTSAGVGSLVGYWKLDDNTNTTKVIDSSGSGNHGTSVRNTSAMHAEGKVNGALSFDGVSDFIDLGSGSYSSLANLPVGDFTASLWIKDEQTATRKLGSIFDFYGDSTGWTLRTISDTSGNRSVHWVICHLTTNAVYHSDYGKLPVNEWAHLVIVWEASSKTGKIYSNDTEVTYQTAVGGEGTYGSDASNAKAIGRFMGSSTQFLKGKLDDVMIFNGALSKDEIEALYYDEGGGTEPDITAPTPDPMTWAVAPYTTGESSISMTAATASDISGAEYYFEETSGNAGGSDSGWQESSTYEDKGLSADTQYTYQVKARDKSANRNETGWSNTASATTDSEDASRSLVGYWKLDDDAADTTVTDSSRYGNYGTAQRNTEDINAPGVIDGALSFNGVSDFIDLGSDVHSSLANLPIGDFTASVWIKDEQTATRKLGTVFDFYGNGTGWTLRTISDTSSNRSVHWVVCHLTANAVYHSDYGTLPTNEWAHLVVVWEASSKTGKIYINSTEATYQTAVPGEGAYGSDASNSKAIGRFAGSSTQFLKGKLDDVMIFNRALMILSRALPKEEIETLYRGADLNGDGIVNMQDFAKFAGQWRKSGSLEADFNKDGKVDFVDLGRIGEDWLLRTMQGND